MLPCGIKPQQLLVAKGQPGGLGQSEVFDFGPQSLPRRPFEHWAPERKTFQPPKVPPLSTVRHKPASPVKASAKEDSVIKRVGNTPSGPSESGKLYVVKFPTIDDLDDGVPKQGLMFNIPVVLAEPGEHAIFVQTNPSRTVFYKAQSPGMTFSVSTSSRYRPEPVMSWLVEQRQIRPQCIDKVQTVIKYAIKEKDMPSPVWANLVVRRCERAGYLYPTA